MHEFQTVVFVDLDATILTGPFEPAVFPAVLGELSRKTGVDVPTLRRLAAEENLARQADPSMSAIQAMDWDDILPAIATRLGTRLEASPIEIARAHAASHSTMLDDAGEVLRALKRTGRALVVATKGLLKYQLPVLDALGLTAVFDDILTPDSHNALKQDRAFYGDWPSRARVRISVGDHYEDDVIAPRRFGFRVIWRLNAPDSPLRGLTPFERPARFDYASEQEVRPDAIILSLGELPAVVTALERDTIFGRR